MGTKRSAERINEKNSSAPARRKAPVQAKQNDDDIFANSFFADQDQPSRKKKSSKLSNETARKKEIDDDKQSENTSKTKTVSKTNSNSSVSQSGTSSSPIVADVVSSPEVPCEESAEAMCEKLCGYYTQYASACAGPLFEGKLYLLNYEPLLQGPVVIPFKKSVTFSSGTSSLQGNLTRRLLCEIPSEAGSCEKGTKYAWVQYKLAETSWTIHGPATAFQILQELSLQIRNSVARHYIKSELLINSTSKNFRSQKEIWRKYRVDELQRSAFIRDWHEPSLSSTPILCLNPDPTEDLPEFEMADAAQAATELYCEDESFGPEMIPRVLHSFVGFRIERNGVFEAQWEPYYIDS